MKLCLDARFRVESGASSYIRNVVPRVMALRPSWTFYLLRFAHQRFDFESGQVRALVPPGDSDLVHLAWASVALPRIVRREGIDVYHGMKMPGPTWTGARTVTTMHSIFDPYMGTFPVDRKTRLFLTWWANPMVRRSDRLIAVSEFVRDCLVESYSTDPERIDVVYNGIDDRFGVRPPAQIETYRSRQGLPEHYVLCVGNVAPVKNHVTAVRAFAEAGLPGEVPLVIAGGTANPYAEEVRREAERVGLGPRLRLLGFVPPDELPLLMNGARLLLFPSLTEGCPVTMLEAFACGLPILASKRGGLWDLGKSVSAFVEDPGDAQGFARELRRLWHDDGALAAYARAGRIHAEAFTWERAAEQHVSTYERVVATQGHPSAA